MYRQPGSRGVLKGVPSGPHTGGARRVDVQKLARATKKRLADALGGRAEPSPLATDGVSWLMMRLPAKAGIVVALSALVAFSAIGFGDVTSAWALQPAPFAIAYVAATTLLVSSLLVIFRKRALASGATLLPGRYLLPLDVVEVPPSDREGHQVIVVTPLGDSRDAVVRAAGRKRDLAIAFADGREISFSLRNEAAGELLQKRLEHVQRLLEDVTYGRALEKSFANDPFFDLRADDSWAQVAPSAAPESTNTSATASSPAQLGVAALAAGAFASVALGVVGFVERNALSDQALFFRAVKLGTPEAFEAYLGRGHGFTEEAKGLRDRAIEARQAATDEQFARRAREKELASLRERQEWELSPAELSARRNTADACVAALREQGSKAHPEVPRIMETLVDVARRSGNPTIPVHFFPSFSLRGYDANEMGPGPAIDWEYVEQDVVSSLEQVFSQTCPASLVRFDRALDAEAGGPGLEVHYEGSWPGVRWERPHNDGWSGDPPRHTMAIDGMKIVFHVTFRGRETAEVARFDLTMPPPAEPSMRVRERSIFAIRGAPAPEGTFDSRVYDAMVARAFDRLYDELYGLFFEGDPRVPVREPAAILE